MTAEMRDLGPVDALDIALEYRHLSDGRIWDDHLVATEIYSYFQQGVRCAYEIGRRLLWAKAVLPHGAFSAWGQEHLPWMSQRAGLPMPEATGL